MTARTVLITGANGFIGKNLCALLAQQPGLTLLRFDLPQTMDDLAALTERADFVFHLAGVNRPLDPAAFQTGNVALTETLVRLLARRDVSVPVVLTSSTQALLDNPYGLSKKAAEDAVFAYGEGTGAPVYVFRLPNVFGKWCRPNYNSVVATFCHNAANGLPLRIDDAKKELTLVYIDDITETFSHILHKTPISSGFCTVTPAYAVTLGELAETIGSFAENRDNLTIADDRADLLVRKLYATFTSYLPTDRFVVEPEMKRDARGYFAELIRAPHFGQISVSRTVPGVTRGNHWHNTKAEKFIVIEGEAVIRLRRFDADAIIEYHVSGERLQVVDIPAGYTHSIKNVGTTDVLTIFWAGDVFDPMQPDTYMLEV